MEPITRLTKKDQPFVWGHELNESFKATLAAVANSILCVYPNPNRPSIIYPDASQKYAMGAMLTQMQDGVEQVFNKAQLKYPVGEQELLPAHEACKHFQPIIYKCEIIIRIIEWYHDNQRHPGVTWTINSISQTFKWKGLRVQVKKHIKTCDACQHHKITGKSHYGQLPLVTALRDKAPFVCRTMDSTCKI
ncbi:hypothetical protein ACHAW6_000700 [Cyclotella cf. meneghiniana]